VNSNLNTNLKDIVGHTLWLEQLKAIGVTMVLAIIGTVVLAFVVKVAVGLRPSLDEEVQGLDFVDHGEVGYHYEEA
jgi:ammonium transporter, Amt family